MGYTKSSLVRCETEKPFATTSFKLLWIRYKHNFFSYLGGYQRVFVLCCLFPSLGLKVKTFIVQYIYKYIHTYVCERVFLN